MATSPKVKPSGKVSSAQVDSVDDPLLSVADGVSGSASLLQGGNDMVQVGVGQGRGQASGFAQLGAKGLRAGASVDASGEVFSAKGGGGVALGDANDPVAQAQAQGSMKLLSAQAKGNAHANADFTKGEVNAGASGSVGAHLAKAEGSAQGGFRIPFTNIMLGGEVSGSAELGVGASGEASAGYDEENGFHARVGGSASLLGGLGGALGLRVYKANKEKGWF